MYKATVLAQQLADDNNIDLSLVQPEGDEITEGDVLTYLRRVMSGEAEPPSEPVDQPPPDWDGQMPSMPIEMLQQAGIETELTAFVQEQTSQPPRRDDVRPPAPTRPAPAAVSTLTIPSVTTPPITNPATHAAAPASAPPAPPVSAATPPSETTRPPVTATSVPPVTATSVPPVTATSVPPVTVSPTPITPAVPDLPVSASTPPTEPPPAAAPRGVLGNLTNILTSIYGNRRDTPPPATQPTPAPVFPAPVYADLTVKPVTQPETTAPDAEPVTQPETTAPDAEPVTEPEITAPDAEPVTEPEITAPDAEPVTEPEITAPDAEPVTEPEITAPDAEPVTEPATTAPDTEPAAAPHPESERTPVLISPRSTVTVRVTADAANFTRVYDAICEVLEKEVDVADLVTMSAERHTPQLFGGVVIGTVHGETLTGLPQHGTVRHRLTSGRRMLRDADLLIVNTSRGPVEEIVYHDRPTICVHYDPAQGKLQISVHGERNVSRTLALALAEDLSQPMRLLI